LRGNLLKRDHSTPKIELNAKSSSKLQLKKDFQTGRETENKKPFIPRLNLSKEVEVRYPKEVKPSNKISTISQTKPPTNAATRLVSKMHTSKNTPRNIDANPQKQFSTIQIKQSPIKSNKAPPAKLKSAYNSPVKT
jgi:hypothetical protein